MDEARVAGGAQRIEIDAGSLRGAHVLWIAGDGAVPRVRSDLPELLHRPDGFVWLDVPRCQTDTSVALEALFGFHTLSLRDARRMNPIPKAQAFSDHTFLILHAVGRRRVATST